VLVGKNTVLSDNPELSVRLWNGKNPVRLILGNSTDIPADYNIFNDNAETIFLSAIDHRLSTIDEILYQLFRKNIISVLAEGGADVLQQFINSNTWNEAHIITSEETISQKTTETDKNKFIKAPEINGQIINTFRFENDTVQILKNSHVLFNT
jgi:diaminohydroxyphosphoribosylaminopyrimidine deaminase/5-amino-6-(5-phosphoribosylamino)uracil reductase